MEVPQEILNEVGNVYNYYLENSEMQVVPFWVIHKYFNSIPMQLPVKVQIAEMVERHLIAHEQMKEQYLDKNLDMYNKAGGAILALEKLLKDLRKSNLSAQQLAG